MIYSDGACSGNPGPGGWAAIVIDERRGARAVRRRSPHDQSAHGDPRAPSRACARFDGPRRVGVYSDSAYVVNCFRDKWYERWLRNGWKNAQKKPVENRDLWEALIAEVERHQVTWHKVAGHSGDPPERPRRPPRRRRHRPAQGPHVRPARPRAGEARCYTLPRFHTLFDCAREGWMVAGAGQLAREESPGSTGQGAG